MSSIVLGGLDVHQEEIQIALVTSNRFGEESVGREKRFAPGVLIHEETIANRPDRIRKAFDRLVKRFGPLEVCYEASSCGYVLHRQLAALGIECKVVAPSMIPKAPGDRVKTDRRDARKLAKLFWANQLTFVRVPDREEEAVRELVRCREACRKDVMRARQRILKFLQRHGVRFTEGKKNWTQKHRRWLKGLKWNDRYERFVFEKQTADLEWKENQLKDLDQEIEKAAFSEPYREQVSRLRCLRGIDTLSAMVVITETGDFLRFPSASHYMGFLGLVPSEDSSGGRVRRGSITKTGNSRARRILTEAAWTYRHRPVLSGTLRKRQEGQPEWVKAHSWKAQQRLYKKFHGVASSKGVSQIAAVAVGRELAGFIWAILQPRDPGWDVGEFSKAWANALDDVGGENRSPAPPPSSVANAPGYS
jgi:transposase